MIRKAKCLWNLNFVLLLNYENGYAQYFQKDEIVDKNKVNCYQ